MLLFSHSVRMLDIIESVVIRRGYMHTRLDGTMGREDRQKTVDNFNNDPSLFLFLISTAAGGVGLNLASANKCVAPAPSLVTLPPTDRCKPCSAPPILPCAAPELLTHFCCSLLCCIQTTTRSVQSEQRQASWTSTRHPNRSDA